MHRLLRLPSGTTALAAGEADSEPQLFRSASHSQILVKGDIFVQTDRMLTCEEEQALDAVETTVLGDVSSKRMLKVYLWRCSNDEQAGKGGKKLKKGLRRRSKK